MCYYDFMEMGTKRFDSAPIHEVKVLFLIFLQDFTKKIEKSVSNVAE